MNPILAMMGGGKANSGRMVFLQAIKAMVSGQSPEDFMRNLAKTNPEFQGLDMDNLESTAHKLSAQKGVDEGELAKKIQTEIQSM